MSALGPVRGSRPRIASQILGGLFVVAFVGSSVIACTLASGWSDLQGGARDAGRDGATGTPGSEGGTSIADDGGSNIEAGGIERAVPCGAATCTGNEGCCAGNARQCTTREVCKPSAVAEFFECTASSQCPSTKRYCCFTLQTWSAQCQNSCLAATDEILCDQARAAEQCEEPKKCLPFEDQPNVYHCR